MDFSDPSLLFSGFLVSMVGLGLFMYGRRSERLLGIAIGLVMMIYPIFVHSVLWMWIVAAACIGAFIALPGEQ